MNLLALLLRCYAYLYHLLLCLVVLGVTILDISSPSASLKLGWVPFTGDPLVRILLTCAVIGLICLLLAVTGLFRYAFPVWCLLVAVQLFRWLILSPYAFPGGKEEFRWVLFLVLGAVGAFLSSLQLLKSKERLRLERGWGRARA